MPYAKVRKGLKSYTTSGYSFKEGIWIEVKKEDVERLHATGRLEFAPDGVKPKNDVKKDIDGVIGITGGGKEAKVVTKGKEEVFDEVLKAEEEAEIEKIKAKYRKKQEDLKKEIEDKKRQEEKNKKAKKTDNKIQDITNEKYIKDKQKQK